MTTLNTSPEFLKEFWPFFILGQQGRPADGVMLSELLTPDRPDTIRTVFSPIFERTNPAAAQGLECTDDAELIYWGRVFGAGLLTGAAGEGTFMPDWLTCEGDLMAATARLLTLPLYQRFDAFLAAMHQLGQA